MSQPSSLPENQPEMELRAWHYQMWCALCLGVIFIAQLSQGLFLTNILAMLLGLLGIVSGLRWGVLLLFLGVGVAQSFHFFLTERYGLRMGLPSRDLDLHDFLLGLGVLGYVIGHHRLQGIWHSLWPPDPRERRGKPRPTFLWLRLRPPIVHHRRKEMHLRAAELISLAVLVPVITLAALTLHAFTRPPRGWLELPLGLGHALILLWILLLTTWLSRNILDLWHIRGSPPIVARMLLQDRLWKELRGEQRRIARWRAWRKLEEKATIP